MLIDIHDSCFDNIEKNKKFFSEISRCVGRCIHLVKFKRKNLEKLLDSNYIYDKEVFRAIFNNFTTYNPYISDTLNCIDRYILFKDTEEALETNEIEGKKVFNLQVAEFNNNSSEIHNILDKPILLCENLTDCNFYEIIAKSYSKYIKLDVLKSIEFSGGGGSQIFNELNNIVKSSKKTCLCIVDSDRKYEGASMGSTAKAVNNELNSLKRIHTCFSQVAHLLILTIHEPENLIPLNVIKLIYTDKSHIAMSENIFDIFSNQCYAGYHRYFDLKNGISKEKLIKDTTYLNYWANLLMLFPQLCSGLPGRILDLFVNKKINCLYEDIPDTPKHIKEEWTNIGKLIISYFCSLPNQQYLN